jgi:uncharacterized membrane protein YoaK (UPF0700 family)
MIRLGRGALVLAALLALTAGFVDAVGFLQLGGFFLSFMSGNTTRLGVALGSGLWVSAGFAALLIGLFVVGVIVASLIPESAPWRRSALLVGVAALLGLAAVFSDQSSWLAAGLAAAAMGALNIVFERDGEIAFGVTYMTGGLARMGIRIAGIIKGGPQWAFVPHLLLWLAMACGAILGCITQALLAGAAFWIAAGVCTGLAGLAGLLSSRDRAAQW